MVAITKIQNTNLESVKSNFSQTVSIKLKTATETAQRAAKTVLNIGTHPLVVSFVTANAFRAYMTGNSISYTMMLDVPAIGLGFSAAAAAMFARLKFAANAKIAETQEAQPSSVIPVTSKNFQTEVLASTTPVILDAYANWCPPCNAVAPTFSELSREMNGKIKFVKMNVDEEQSLAKELQIEKMPTFLIFKDGKVVDRQVGGMDKTAFLTKFVKSLV